MCILAVLRIQAEPVLRPLWSSEVPAHHNVVPEMSWERQRRDYVVVAPRGRRRWLDRSGDEAWTAVGTVASRVTNPVRCCPLQSFYGADDRPSRSGKEVTDRWGWAGPGPCAAGPGQQPRVGPAAGIRGHGRIGLREVGRVLGHVRGEPLTALLTGHRDPARTDHRGRDL